VDRFYFSPSFSPGAVALVLLLPPFSSLVSLNYSEKLPGYNKLSALLTQSKKTEQRQWLKDVSSVPLQQSLRHLDVAYRNFFNSRNGKHKGKKSGLPKFKKKTNNQTAEFTKTAFSVSGEYVYLAKIGDIKPVSPVRIALST
jgi:putative transposase